MLFRRSYPGVQKLLGDARRELVTEIKRDLCQHEVDGRRSPGTRPAVAMVDVQLPGDFDRGEFLRKLADGLPVQGATLAFQ
ncbi:hypothetical protein D3C75_1146120 [compost metagenome]